MTRHLLLCLLLTAVTGAAVGGSELPDVASSHLLKVGLSGDDAGPSPVDSTPDQQNPCADMSFSRNIRYGESEANLLDVATGKTTEGAQRPVLLLVAGESFASNDSAPDIAATMQEAAMCFAARNGMVGVRVNYRLAPANPWPAAAKDVAAASSWVHENIDLFGGSRDEIVAIGYAAGAFHVASLLAHPEFQAGNSGLAGAVLVSGIYRADADTSMGEKSYFGEDAGKYEERSVFPGILNIETPILLAWSALDPQRLVTQGEKLKERLCNSPTHCPHTAVLRTSRGLASLSALDGSSDGLAEPTLELIREIEARGLP
jgi:acetyl esterase/lipase